MPRPLKPPGLRQRTNRAATARTLSAGTKRKKVPPLPAYRKPRQWHSMARDWWRALWLSPMSDALIVADIQQLYMVVELVHRYWENPTAAGFKEVRLATQPYGLNPLDRRRLEWVIEEPEAESGAKPKKAGKAPPEEADPREGLRLVAGGKTA